MIEIKMNEGEFELKALADKSQFLAEAVLVVKELTGAYAQQRSISFDEAFEEIREKVKLAKGWEKECEVLDREDET